MYYSMQRQQPLTYGFSRLSWALLNTVRKTNGANVNFDKFGYEDGQKLYGLAAAALNISPHFSTVLLLVFHEDIKERRSGTAHCSQGDELQKQ